MKYIKIIVPLVLSIFVLAQCSMKRELNQDLRNLNGNLPPGFSGKSQADLKEMYHRGYALYKVSCTGSACHGAGSKGQDTIPAFTFFQLDKYESAVKKGDPNNHAVMKKLSQDQVRDILSFLLFRTFAKKFDHLKGKKVVLTD